MCAELGSVCQHSRRLHSERPHRVGDRKRQHPVFAVRLCHTLRVQRRHGADSGRGDAVRAAVLCILVKAVHLNTAAVHHGCEPRRPGPLLRQESRPYGPVAAGGADIPFQGQLPQLSSPIFCLSLLNVWLPACRGEPAFLTKRVRHD
jgi:hypothetical protein